VTRLKTTLIGIYDVDFVNKKGIGPIDVYL